MFSSSTSTARKSSPPEDGGDSCHLQRHRPGELADPGNARRTRRPSEKGAKRYFGARGIQVMKTCTPYQVGNVPVKGEHCAWMESSAVVYCNSVLGARTNTEGRESTGAAMLTGRIPYWGFHQREPVWHAPGRCPRRGDDIMDWGLLGYCVGEVVQDGIPVINGAVAPAEPDPAQAFRRGGRIVRRRRDVPHGGRHARGARSRPPSAAQARGHGPLRRGRAHAHLRDAERASERDVDFVMLGCPHASIEQSGRGQP